MRVAHIRGTQTQQPARNISRVRPGARSLPDSRARSGLEMMPAIPVIQPLPSRYKAHARPMSKPPVKALQGVNAFQSVVMGGALKSSIAGFHSRPLV